MRVTAAAARFAHTFKAVTQIERVGVVCLQNQCPSGVCCLFHIMLQAEPWSDLKVGEKCGVFHCCLDRACGVVPSSLRFLWYLGGRGYYPRWCW